MKTNHIIELDRLSAADQTLSGAKAYNCARLKQAGFSVPDGLVVLANAKGDEVTAIAEHPWFAAVPSKTLFAVRSSGIGEDGGEQSFAGIHQTALDVRREDLAAAVEACRQSAYTPQALEYRRAKGISIESIQMGVLIQRMVQPVAAGVAFTVNPVSGDQSEIVINSSWGVGEALVSGQVDPDELVVRKLDGELLWSRAGEKGAGESSPTLSLSPAQVFELAGIVLAVEQHYGAPQDVEWCHDGAMFWIVQSRPITTGGVAAKDIEWTRANLAEVLPDITSPQVLSAFESLLNRAERQYMGKLLAPDDELGPMMRSFCGRLYFNLSQVRRMCALAGVSQAEMLRSMGHADAIQPSDERPLPLSLTVRLSGLPDILRLAWRQLRVARIVRDDHDAMRRFLERLSAEEPRAHTDDQLWSVVEEWLRDGPRYTETVLLLTGVQVHEATVRKLCRKAGFSFERLVYPQLAIGQRSVSAQQAFDLVALAETGRGEPAVVQYFSQGTPNLFDMRRRLSGTRFLAELEGFLQSYGHRGLYETDWSLPRYSEDPTPLLLAIRAHLEDPAAKPISELLSRQERESVDAWKSFDACLSLWQKWTMRPRIRRTIRTIKQWYVWRERTRSDIAQVLAAVRRYHLVLAQRFVARGWLEQTGDYFQLHLEEIAGVINRTRSASTLRALASKRSAEAARHRAIRMPLLMRESELARLIRTAGVSRRLADDSQLTGHPVSGGCVEAEVAVVRDPGDFHRMKPGAILVAPATDPSWTPLFTLASGVIVEIGGVLSHASTIAREYGLPALANVKHATRLLTTGERVRLDAVRGVVERLQHKCAVAESRNLVEVG